MWHKREVKIENTMKYINGTMHIVMYIVVLYSAFFLVQLKSAHEATKFKLFHMYM